LLNNINKVTKYVYTTYQGTKSLIIKAESKTKS